MIFYQERLHCLMFQQQVVIKKGDPCIMKDNIIIKKFPNGITLLLDPEIDFLELMKELGEKFMQNRQFFRDAKIALRLEGRELSEEEEKIIVNTIRLNSDLQIICLVGKNEETDKNFVKAIQRVDRQKTDNIGKFYRGSLKNNQSIETESSIVILGDVNPGCSVTAAKDIIILGALYGEAYAGSGGDPGHYIVALEMSPEKIKFGDFRYRAKEKSKWGFKPKVQPKIAYVKDNHITMEPITKELLEILM